MENQRRNEKRRIIQEVEERIERVSSEIETLQQDLLPKNINRVTTSNNGRKTTNSMCISFNTSDSYKKWNTRFQRTCCQFFFRI